VENNFISLTNHSSKIMQEPINELISGKKCDDLFESVCDDEGTMSRRDDQERWQWREEVKLIARNSGGDGQKGSSDSTADWFQQLTLLFSINF
jgi:hypothetical protein